MSTQIDFLAAVEKVELMKMAVHSYMRKERGGEEVISSSELIHYIPSAPEDNMMYFRMDYRTHSQSSSSLTNVARAKFTNEAINMLVGTGKVQI